MSEIDWSKTPAGATHWEPKLYEIPEGWMRHSAEGRWYFWHCLRSEWIACHVKDGERVDRMIPRPSPSWNGEGLPPVGAACEVNDARTDNWRAVDGVIAHASLSDRDVAVFRIGDYIAYSPADRFRPIRTPEQIAADEREAAVNGMLCYDALGGSRRGLAEALYDAGYRKQADK